MDKRIFEDFRFWILVFFVLRLYGITNPPIETGHSWRQSFTCMVARNFLEEDPDIFYPRIDYSGEREDVVPAEFPVFNYLIFLTAKVFGWQHWYGRLINLIITSIGVFFFYKLVRRYFNEKTAFFAGIILLSSIWFGFSRKIMPDTFSVAVAIIGLYYLSRYVDTNRSWNILMFVLFASIGGLSKIPTTTILSLSALSLICKEVKFYQKVVIAIAGMATILIISAWYFYWQPHLLETYGNKLYFPFPLLWGLQEVTRLWPQAIEKFYFDALHSFVAFALFLTGIFFMIKKKETWLIITLFLTLFIFSFFIIKTGFVFPTHSYYIIPFVPVMALIAGYGLAHLKIKKWAYLVLFIISIEAILNQQHDFRLKPEEMYKTQLEALADQFTEKSDKIAITGGLNPQEIYFIHRKGWSLLNEQILDETKILEIKSFGCKYLFVNKHTLQANLPYHEVYSDENYIVYQL
jgi:hypothetical protein